jgi:hypothetical protein
VTVTQKGTRHADSPGQITDMLLPARKVRKNSHALRIGNCRQPGTEFTGVHRSSQNTSICNKKLTGADIDR